MALGGGAAGLVWTQLRKPTPAQAAAAGQLENARQWRSLTAGQIFPATENYHLTIQAKAALVGIAPQASCASAFDAAATRALDGAGCVTVLRATYVDASRTVLVTVGIAVMTSATAANSAYSALDSGDQAALLPVAFPGTIASGFTRQAIEAGHVQSTSRYLVVSVAGYADGRDAVSDATAPWTGDSTTTDLPNQLADNFSNAFTASPNPCADPEVRC